MEIPKKSDLSFLAYSPVTDLHDLLMLVRAGAGKETREDTVRIALLALETKS